MTKRKSPHRPIKLRSPAAMVAILTVAGSQQAISHHSFAQRVAGELQSIEVFDGTIELYKLLNPHSALIVSVADGTDSDWLVELSSASTLGREGWTEDFLSAGDKASIAILASRTPNRGRLRAMLVHGAGNPEASRLIVAYGIRGDTPVMSRLRARLETCEGIEGKLRRGECFLVDAAALQALEQEFPGDMGYILP